MRALNRGWTRGVDLLLPILLPFLFFSTVAGEDGPPKGSSLAGLIESKQFSKAARQVSLGGNVDAAQADGMTPLLWACHHDQVDLVHSLLKAGASVNKTNHYGVSALSLACSNGSVGVTRALLKSGADPNVSLRGGETPLMTAARTGRLDVVRLLIRQGAKLNAVEHRGQTALMWASAAGHHQVVEELLKHRAEFRKPLKSGFTPMFFAARAGHRKVVQALLKAGEDVNRGMKPPKPGGKAVRASTSALILAIENGHFELALDLVKAGADPNDQRTGYTPLHTLTWVRKPNRGDGPDGAPPPRIVGRLNSLKFAEQLVRLGADVNRRLDRGGSKRGRIRLQGMTPFLLAAKTADIEYLKLLVKLGADPLLANRDGCTPLMAACGIGTIAPREEAGTQDEALISAKYIHSLGGNVNTIDRNGETCMHGAAYKSFPEIAFWLAEHGAKIAIWNRPNKYSWTPLHIAEGHRVGNFKPSAETIKAIHQIMIKAGKTPPPPRPRKKRKGYQ